MSRQIATKEAVTAAARELIARGQPVTADGIRCAIGGGSKSTILARLGEIRPQLLEAADASHLPAAVADAFNACGASLWDVAQKEAAAQFEQDRRAWRLICQGLEADLEGEKAQNLELRRQRREAEQRAQDLERRLAELQAEVPSMQAVLKEMRRLGRKTDSIRR